MKDVNLKCILMFSTALVGVLNGCSNREFNNKKTEIAVTNSYLQCVVKDLCGDDTEILCLAPPGMCPGHFDISPMQIKQLCDCKILLLFDFQQKIEDSLSRMKKNGLKTALLKPLPGLCVPETYVVACREVADILSKEYPERQTQYEQRLKLIEKRMKELSLELRTAVEQTGIKAAEVVVSDHQAKFANWLGVEIIATFQGSDTETAFNVNQYLTNAKSRNVRFIIANKQEGTALADVLADRLQAKAVVFSNFPEINADSNGFDRLVRNNVRNLVETADK